jgi:hypothetical protein
MIRYHGLHIRRMHEQRRHTMEHIRNRVGIDAPIERVYEAVATPEGLAGGDANPWPADVSLGAWR